MTESILIHAKCLRPTGVPNIVHAYINTYTVSNLYNLTLPYGQVVRWYLNKCCVY